MQADIHCVSVIHVPFMVHAGSHSVFVCQYLNVPFKLKQVHIHFQISRRHVLFLVAGLKFCVSSPCSVVTYRLALISMSRVHFPFFILGTCKSMYRKNSKNWDT